MSARLLSVTSSISSIMSTQLQNVSIAQEQFCVGAVCIGELLVQTLLLHSWLAAIQRIGQVLHHLQLLHSVTLCLQHPVREEGTFM